MRILLVEDNDTNRDMLSRRLKRKGYEVLMATDGRAGLEAALREKPDLVLMDIDLPKLSGLDATRELRRFYPLDELPVIALTAHAMAEDRQISLDAGCNEYEPKPVDFAGLVAKIETLGKQSKAQRGT